MLLSHLKALIIIIIISMALGLGVNFLRPNSLPWSQDWEETLARRSEQTLPDGLVVIDLQRMKQIYEQKDVIVLDARSNLFFKFQHIPGAQNLPVEEADQRLPEFVSKLPSDVRVITYCDSATCHFAKDLARKLLEAGHKDVAVFLGGIAEWQESGMPTTSG